MTSRASNFLLRSDMKVAHITSAQILLEKTLSCGTSGFKRGWQIILRWVPVCSDHLYYHGTERNGDLHSLIFCYTDEIKMMAFCHPDCTRKFLQRKMTSHSITTGQNEWSHSLEEQRYNWSKIKPFLLNQQTSKCQIVSSYALPA